VKIIDRCDNFYQIVNAETGEAVGGIPMNGRFAGRSAAIKAAVAAGYSLA
jgi:hypothetical protein